MRANRAALTEHIENYVEIYLFELSQQLLEAKI